MKYLFRFLLLLLSLSTLRAEAQTDGAQLSAEVPGFKSGFAKVNGIRLHYVEGGNGAPLILLPGWLQTWWGYHKIMPALAKHFHVIVVDIRGMGDSDQPAGGYRWLNCGTSTRGTNPPRWSSSRHGGGMVEI